MRRTAAILHDGFGFNRKGHPAIISQTSSAAAAVSCARVPARSLNRRAWGSVGTKLQPNSLLTMTHGQAAALNADSCALHAAMMAASESANRALAQSVRQSRITPLGGGASAARLPDTSAGASSVRHAGRSAR